MAPDLPLPSITTACYRITTPDANGELAIDEIMLALHMALMAVVTRLLAVERINCPCIRAIHFEGGIRAGSRVHCSRQRGCTDGSRDDNRTKSVNRVTFVHKIKASDVACDSYLVTVRGNSRGRMPNFLTNATVAFSLLFNN